MHGTLNKVFIFVAGAAVGSVVTWKLLKDKYAKIAQEEIDSVKEVFSKKKDVSKSIDDVAKSANVTGEALKTLANTMNEATHVDYSNIVKDLGYVDNEKGGSEMVDKPYVIEPEDFGECDYETVSLTYYSDGILTDEDDDIVEDVEGVVGVESLNHFGEYEDDSVFVRNDRLETDYEILLDLRNYADVHKVNPNRVDHND